MSLYLDFVSCPATDVDHSDPVASSAQPLHARMGCRMADEARRASWDEYFMSIAQVVATRSTCDAQVRRRGDRSQPHDPVDRLQRLDPRHAALRRRRPHDGGRPLRRTIHAEANAIIQAARNGVTHRRRDDLRHRAPVLVCFKQLANAGIVADRVRRVLSRRADLRRSPSRSASSWSTCRCPASSCRGFRRRARGDQLSYTLNTRLELSCSTGIACCSKRIRRYHFWISWRHLLRSIAGSA